MPTGLCVKVRRDQCRRAHTHAAIPTLAAETRRDDETLNRLAGAAAKVMINNSMGPDYEDKIERLTAEIPGMIK